MMPSEPIPPSEPPSPIPVHPDLLAWAQQTLDVQEVLEELREMKATGGEPLESFIAEIEAVVRGS
jgi:hypothetical protein